MFADQYTKFVFVDLNKAKSEALAHLKKFVLSVRTPNKLRQDNAKEFLSELFKVYCLDAGILQEKTIPETPQQNGLAERCHMTLLEMARCLLIDLGPTKMMWSAAILHATKIRNLVVRREEKCPAELIRGIKPKLSISKLTVFGCTVFMSKRDKDVSKLEPQALKGMFLGYTEGDNGYLVHIPNTPKWAQSLSTQTPDLLDEGSQQLGIWRPNDGHQGDGNKEEQVTSTAIKEEWNDLDSVKTQETKLRRDASYVEEAAPDEECTAAGGILRYPESLEDSDIEDFPVRDSWIL